MYMSEIIYKPLIELISENPSMTETITPLHF